MARIVLLALVALAALAPLVMAVTTLPNYAQCGGKGGNCAQFTCVDGPYPNTKCAGGGTCVKQNPYYYQCLGGSGTAAPTKKVPTKAPTTKAPTKKVPTKAPTTKAPTKKVPTKAPTTKAPTKKATTKKPTATQTIAKYKQCGGKGAGCAKYTCAADAPFPHTKCAAGSTCTRQNSYYWQCL